MLTSEADCPFCAIAQGRDPAALVVYEDDQVVGFTPPEPASLGHTLLVPRHHVPDVWSLGDSDADALGRAALRVARAVRGALDPAGLNIVQSNGEAATQTVGHLHIHLVPRWPDDNVGDFWPETTHFTDEQRLGAFRRVRAALVTAEEQTTDMENAGTSSEDRRKHLEFIQAVVTRMSSASAAAKGWLLAVVTVIYGYAITNDSSEVALLGVVATLVFGLIDANYLRQEKAYRKLYDAVARSEPAVPLFTLDPSDADDPIPQSARTRERILRVWRRWVPCREVWFSWSIGPFYTTFLVVGAVIAI